MNAREDQPLKYAFSGGIAGLFIGVAMAVWTWEANGAGVMTLVEAGLQLVLWTFGGALLGGAVGFGLVWFSDRKFGRPDQDEGLDTVMQKTSFLHGLQAETQKCYLGIGSRVVSANEHLAAAEKEFAEGAFAPFWDEIERAANDLAAYKNEVEYLQRNVSVYNNEAGELARLGGDAVAPLALPLNQLPDARPSAERFMGLVRQAQKNFQFAMIFEQRKTNQLLHTGFGNLGAAIHSLGDSINASLDKLSKSLDGKLDQLIAIQAPVRHMMAKAAAIRNKTAPEPEILPRYDVKPDQGSGNSWTGH